MANQPDMLLIDKQQWNAVTTETAVPCRRNKRQKEQKNILKKCQMVKGGAREGLRGVAAA